MTENVNIKAGHVDIISSANNPYWNNGSMYAIPTGELQNIKNAAPKVPEILDRSWFDLSKHCMEGCVLCQASRWPGPSTLSFSQTWRRNTDPTWMESGRPQRCPPKEDGTMVTGVANVFGFVQEGAYRCFDTSDSKRFWHTSEIIHGSLKSDPYHPGTRHSCRSAPRTDRL